MADQPRDIVAVLGDIDDGALLQQLTALWPEVVKAVRATNQPGSLTLTLSAKMDRGVMVVVAAKVATKLPAPAIGTSLFFSDDAGNLTRHDPKQQTLLPDGVRLVSIRKDGSNG